MDDLWADISQSIRDARKEGQAARMLADEGATPEKGRHYTVSRDFVCGDRSYSHAVLHVVEVNASHALVRMLGERRWGPELHLLSIDERAWYPAEDLAAAITPSA